MALINKDNLKTDSSYMPMVMTLCIEVCKIGIVDEVIRRLVDKFMFGSTIEIGTAILELTGDILKRIQNR